MSTRFRGGAQSGSHRPVSTPCPPNRTCGSPASGSPVGSCISHTERQFGAASSHRRSLAVPVALRAPGSQKLHGFTRGAPLQRAVRPVHALTAPSLPSVSPAPSLTHVMFRNSLPFHAGFLGKATPAGLRPSVIPPHLRPLSSTGITPRLQSYGPLRHPAGPACPSRGSGCRVHGTGRTSRVATPSIFHACRRHYPGGNRPVLSSLSSQPVGGLPLISEGSASATPVSRPAQRSLSFRPAWSLGHPRRPFSPEGFNPCRYLHEPLWPLPAGTTVAGWGSHPPGKRAFPRRTEKSGLGKGRGLLPMLHHVRQHLQCVVGEHLEPPGDRQLDQADGCRLEKKVVSALPADQELGPRAPRQEEVSALALTVMSPRSLRRRKPQPLFLEVAKTFGRFAVDRRRNLSTTVRHFANQVSEPSFPWPSAPSPGSAPSTSLTGSARLIQTSALSSAARGGPATKRSGRAA